MTTSLKNNQTIFIRTKLDKEKFSKPFLWLPSCRHPTAMLFLLQMRSSSPSRGLADKTGGSLSHFSRNASPASESDTRKTPTSQNVHKLQTGSSLSYDKRYPETPVSLGKLDIPRTVFWTKKGTQRWIFTVRNDFVYSGFAQLLSVRSCPTVEDPHP